jgi:hypothetical protein
MVKPPPENLCAWCGKFVDEDMEIHAIGARFPHGVDMKDHEGNVIFLGFKGRDEKVPALIPTNDAEAKKHCDLMFMTCSETCFKKLKRTLNKEDDILDVKKIS